MCVCKHVRRFRIFANIRSKGAEGSDYSFEGCGGGSIIRSMGAEGVRLFVRRAPEGFDYSFDGQIMSNIFECGTLFLFIIFRILHIN